MRAWKLGPVAALAMALSLPADAQQRPRERPEWRPDWAREMPYMAPPGHLGIHVFPAERAPCTLQIYMDNNTDQTIREVFGVIVVYTERDAVVTRFHLSYIDPNRRRGGGSFGQERCTGRILRAELREISPCHHGRARMRGCGAPIIPVAPQFRQASDIIPFSVAADYDR